MLKSHLTTAKSSRNAKKTRNLHTSVHYTGEVMDLSLGCRDDILTFGSMFREVVQLREDIF